MNAWILIGAALAGGVGAGLRYVVDVLVVGPRPGRFPLGVFLVNISGSFILGVLTGLGSQIVASDASWIIGVGVLGGYTTFSTVSVESALLLRSGQARRGWLNAVGTLVVGVSAAAAGLALGGLLSS